MRYRNFNIKLSKANIKELRIILPKWVTLDSLAVMTFFLMYNELDENIFYSDSLLQRLLWLSDFLQLDALQDIILKQKIIPALNVNNSLLFLNEAFKKLKIEEEATDSWYLLFNTAINITAKNLLWIMKNQKKELFDCNEKIIEEVVGRSLRYSRGVPNKEKMAPVELLCSIRGRNSIIELLVDQRESLVKKEVNSNSKLSMVDFIIL